MTRSYEVRIATIDDAARVTALLQASYPALMASAYDPAALAAALPLMTKANEKLLASGTYYVAEAADGALVGCGGWTRERPGTAGVEPGLAHIRHFATHPAWTGRGIGRALLTRCEADARSAHIEVLECHSSLNAEAFYTALGFETVGRFDIDLEGKARLPSVLMRKRIAERRAGTQAALDGNSRTQPGTDRRGDPKSGR